MRRASRVLERRSRGGGGGRLGSRVGCDSGGLGGVEVGAVGDGAGERRDEQQRDETARQKEDGSGAPARQPEAW